ncbi:hypothetical protein C0216_08705 [Streptomyces globosus]|uniref:Uncharacterized protein n=1 Tax=Streptomyces globosus TaxID=68209 RepID=A0A344TY11_9ACTN|nr:hypothetical protein [Streptomyces globosus]AXE23532.1 hypothetical protein C0216_08705 [Streptomyces globosus]
MRWRIADGIAEAQSKVNRDPDVQVNPVQAEHGHVTEIEGHSPGCFRSDMALDPEMQCPDGRRPSGSYSPSSVNTEEKESRRWTRRMVVDDASEYGHAVRRADGDADLYYRSGRAKLAVTMVPAEFQEGVETGREER